MHAVTDYIHKADISALGRIKGLDWLSYEQKTSNGSYGKTNINKSFDCSVTSNIVWK